MRHPEHGRISAGGGASRGHSGIADRAQETSLRLKGGSGRDDAGITVARTAPAGAPFKLGLSGGLAICPFCVRKPSFGVLRQMGDGAARSMVCSFCLAQWEFRRLVCPGCGEENDPQLPVFTASDFDHIRVECCDTCKTYVKTIDLTKNGRAEPVVDELASAPLDLWAREHGYAKLHANLLGM